MAIGLSFGSSSDDSKSFSISKSDVEKQAQSETVSTGTQKGSGVQEEEQVVQLLDEETQALLKDIVTNLGSSFLQQGQDFTGDIGALAASLTDRAGEAQSFVAEQTGAIIEDARRRGELELGASITGLAQATGSSQNSLVQLLAQQGRNDLETQLAGLTSELTLRGRELQTEELQTALPALVQGQAAQGADVQQIGAITELLRGATAVQRGTTLTEQETQTEEKVSQLLNELQKLFSSSYGRGSQSSSEFGFDFSSE